MTGSQFKRWLNERIQFLRGLQDYENPDDHPYAQGLQEEAYQRAVDLGLPEATQILGKPGPVTVRLMEALEAFPEPDVLTMEEAADYIGCSVSGLRKIKNRNEIRYSQKGQGPIKFRREWLDEYLAERKTARSPAQKRRPPIKSSGHGFDPGLLR